MSYRDELEAAHARIASLERELTGAKQELSLANGQSRALVRIGDSALARSESPAKRSERIFGAPTKLVYTRKLEGELPEEGYAEIIELIRDRLENMGTVSTLPGSLAWSTTVSQQGAGTSVTFYARSREGKTELRIEEKLGPLAGGIFGGIGGGAGVGAIMAPLATAWLAPVLPFIAIPLWLAGIYAGCRTVFRRSAQKRAHRLVALLDEIEAATARIIAQSAAMTDLRP